MVVDSNILIQVIIGVGAFGTGIFTLIRYQIKEGSKREKTILEHHAIREREMLEYFTTKNGHIERIAGDFTKVTRESTKAINELTIQIQLLKKK